MLSAGCREEPTIVIKFEPNDMGGKVAAAAAGDLATAAAAPVAAADLGTVEKTADKDAAKKAGGECKAAADCVVEPPSAATAPTVASSTRSARRQAAAGKAAHAAKCKTTMCTMMLSTDPSCGMRADCVDGACVMVKK